MNLKILSLIVFLIGISAIVGLIIWDYATGHTGGLGLGMVMSIIGWGCGLLSLFLLVAGGGIPESFHKPTFLGRTSINSGFFLGGISFIILGLFLNYLNSGSDSGLIFGTISMAIGVIILLAAILRRKKI